MTPTQVMEAAAGGSDTLATAGAAAATGLAGALAVVDRLRDSVLVACRL
jgi:hypothetical protein